MGARTWRTTTTCAALLLTATGCMVGPTIKDEPKKPAAAASDIPTAPVPGPGGVPQPGGQPPPGNTPAGPGSSTTASPSPTRLTYTIGGDQAFDFAPGMQLWIKDITPQGPIAVGAPGRQRVAVRILVRNDSGGDLRPYGLIVSLRACPSPNGTCTTPGDGADREEPTTIPTGSEQEFVRYFAVTKPDELSNARVEVAYNTARAGFTRSGTS